MNLLTSPLLVLSVILTTVPVFATFPSLDEIKVLLHVYFPTMNENTTIYSFLSDDRNVALLERFHEYSCIDLKRKRKIRSLDWFRDMFTLPIDQAIQNGSTFMTPEIYTLNSTEEEIFSKEGRFYNPASPLDDNSTVQDIPTTEATGPTLWPTDSYKNKIPKKNMRGIDYINMINNDVDQAKDELGAGGCPLGFGRG